VELAQDGIWQHRNVALLDFEDGTGPCRNGTTALNTTVRGTAAVGNAQGDVVGVRLTLGVPFELNHGDPTLAPAPLNTTAMFWNWQGGYKFVKFDTSSSGISDQRPAARNVLGPVTRYSVHLGSTGCSAATRTQAPTACHHPNRATVELRFGDLGSAVIVADMGRVLARSNVDINAPGTAAGCMSAPDDADCPSILQALGTTPGSVQTLLAAR
jgi:uncharacterized repeat protein (TIGR04052 family)